MQLGQDLATHQLRQVHSLFVLSHNLKVTDEVVFNKGVFGRKLQLRQEEEPEAVENEVDLGTAEQYEQE